MTKTVSLETARLLKAAGWKHETTSWYPEDKLHKKMLRSADAIWPHDGDCCLDQTACSYCPPYFYPAPSTDELLEALPRTRLELKTMPDDGKWQNGWFASSNIGPFVLAQGENPAEALAALWLELRKQNAV